MAITEPHLGCAYETKEGTAVCVGIVPGKMVFALTAMAANEKVANGMPRGQAMQNFMLSLDDPSITEVYCHLA